MFLPMVKSFFHTLVIVFLACLLASCEDRIDYGDQVIGPGEALVSADIDYEPSRVSLGASRAPGDAISEIKTLDVVIYKANGEFFKLFKKNQLALEHSVNVSTPDDFNTTDTLAEDTTARVSFTLPEPLPFGKYYMYAVVNLGKELTEDMAKTAETLKSQVVDWQFGDVSQNAQMFGYFTPEENKTSKGYDAPQLIVNRSNVTFHSWVRRLASKVTIAYNGSGLKQNVFVFIHKATIKQIPLTCKLGEDNTPTEKSDVDDPANPAKEQIFIYDSKGIVADGDDKNPDYSSYDKWLTVANGSGIKGTDHSKSAQALYFYENMQGNYENYPESQRRWFDKRQNPDSVGTNVTEGMPDFKDNVPYGTYIEVEGYYQSRNENYVSEGPIKYRFMLGQNVSYDYNSVRNRHYKLTLHFRGWANQPDWHIEYTEETPELYVPPVFVPYMYNRSVEYPIRFNGNIYELTAEIIENNWAPYDPKSADEVPPKTVGSTDYTQRTLQFNWNETVWRNEGAYTQACPNPSLNLSYVEGSGWYNNTYESNFLYGRHKTEYNYLDGTKKDTPYYVTPIWVGFLRLQQPDAYASEDTELPSTIFANSGAWFYSYPRTDNTQDVRGGMKRYYEGTGGLTIGKDTWSNTTNNLGKRVFKEEDLTAGTHGTGRNSYTIVEETVDGAPSKTLRMKLWTQPKTIGWISGFGGNNPYEYYGRKAVVRFTAKFKVTVGAHEEDQVIVRDVPVIQSPRITNPKAIWRKHDANTGDFNVKLMVREDPNTSTNFTTLVSQGEWSAFIKAGDRGFITLAPGGNAKSSGDKVVGLTDSPVDFKIKFNGPIDDTETKCCIVEVLYHGNSCVHDIFVRQGYNHPIQIDKDGPYWSSFNVYSCDLNTRFGQSDETVDAVLTKNPRSLGNYFKKGNYAQAIDASNNSQTNLGPLQAPDGTSMTLVGGGSSAWSDIKGIARTGSNSKTTTSTIDGVEYDTKTWHWAKFKAIVTGEERVYRVPTINEFKTLMNHDFGIGVMYGSGATETASTTLQAFGYLDLKNDLEKSTQGMRGFVCYNASANSTLSGNHIFFPIGSSALGRRTIQGASTSYLGTLRYGATDQNLTQAHNKMNQFRPVPFNMSAAPGAIYWAWMEVGDCPGWDMNYFDLNFNEYDYAISFNKYGDALPIRLIYDGSYN